MSQTTRWWRTPSVASTDRRHGIDFWRGFILCTIFINHVPGTIFEKLTFKNFGLSDSAEAFVLIAGLSLALAHGRRILAGQHAAVVASLARRAVKLYGTHIGLSMVGIAIFQIGADLTENADLMQQHGRDLALEDPTAALLGLLSLGHQFGYFNILPMYVVLMGLAPAMLIAAQNWPRAMLGVSLSVYALTRFAAFNIPTWPMSGTWFFDPFAWQFLMAVGVVVGLQVQRGEMPTHSLLLALAATVVTSAALCASDGLGALPGLYDAVRPLLDIDKTMLGVGRIAHALSLAYCVHALQIGKVLQGACFYKPLCLVGQNGLAMFGFASLLSAIGQIVTATFEHTALVDSVIVGGGLAVMLVLARALDRRTLFPVTAREMRDASVR